MNRSQSLRRSTSKKFCEALEGRRYFAAVSFANHVDFAAGSAPSAIATADFNQDGKADLAVADSVAKNVKIFFGNGSGGFTAGPVLTVSAPPVSLTVGKFNAGSAPDLAVGGERGTNSGTTVTVFLNTGDGTFGIGQATTVALNGGNDDPIAIASGDLNEDGIDDVVATNYEGNADILISSGTGSFANPVAYTVDDHPTAIAVGDFTKDGNLDIAVTGTLSDVTGTIDRVSVLLGQGTGVFTSGGEFTVGAPASNAIAVADLNGDGRPEIITGNSDGTGSILNNTSSTGTLFSQGATGAFASASMGIAVGDFNGDSLQDIASVDGSSTTSNSNNSVTVVAGAPGGTFLTGVSFAVGTNPTGLAVADFNGDGKPDIAAANRSAGTVSVLLNNSTTAAVTTKTTLSADVDPAVFGTAVTLTATITATLGTKLPTGNVQFVENGTVIGTSGINSGTNQATFSTSTLGVGTHSIRAKYVGDTNFAASTSTVLSQIISATATDGPDLIGAITSTTLPNSFVAGEKATVKVTVTNQGNFDAKGSINNQLYLSLDSTIDESDILLPVKGAFDKGSVIIKPGKSKVLTGTFSVPSSAIEGTYELLAKINSSGAISETTNDNNTAISPTPFASVTQFGTVGGRKGLALTLSDSDGTAVTYKLTGPGTGMVATGDSGISLTLTGTTLASSLTITTSGGTNAVTLTSLTTDAGMHSITGKTVSIIGSVAIPGGLGQITLLTLQSADGISDTMTLGAGPSPSININSLNGATIHSATGLKALNVGTANAIAIISGGTGGIAPDFALSARPGVTAPFIRTLTSTGDLTADITLNSGTTALSRVAIGGGLNQSIFSVIGSIGKLTAGSILNLTLSATGGVGSVTDLGDFNGTIAGASLGQIAIDGNLTSSAILAGTAFGADRALGGGDDTFAAGTVGSLRVAGHTTTSIVAAGMSPIDTSNLFDPTNNLLPGGAIKSITLAGTVDSGSKFVAASVPKKAIVNGQPVDPTTDSHFHF